MNKRQYGAPLTLTIDVLGPEKRRRRTTQEKIAIVQQSFEPGMTVSLVARQHGVAASQLFLWRKQYQEGSLTAVAAGEQVVPASELAAAMKQIKELQRLLGKKTMENELLKEAVEYGRAKKLDSARALIARGWGVSLVSRCLRVSRAQLHVILRRTDDWMDGRRSRHTDDTDVLLRIHHVIGELPTYGYRRVWALLRRQAELDCMPAINAKRVYRIIQHLRRSHSLRHGRRHTRKGERGTINIVNGTPIHERSRNIDNRRSLGHWEGDLVSGTKNSHIATLVDRKSRYTIILRLRGKDSVSVNQALTDKFLSLPSELRKSLTWDRGMELARHLEFTVSTGVKVYFCDPQSPWQRGTNENTNGLIRQYFPKKTCLAQYTQHELDLVAAQLNNRPRKTLKFKTPKEIIERGVALTD
ncbi:IS30 family transposase [Escherichia coli]|uniref:IS30 family transposase n=14 Tax=Escherichia coli TaxID=562 RepID=UPI003AF78D02